MITLFLMWNTLKAFDSPAREGCAGAAHLGDETKVSGILVGAVQRSCLPQDVPFLLQLSGIQAHERRSPWHLLCSVCRAATACLSSRDIVVVGVVIARRGPRTGRQPLLPPHPPLHCPSAEGLLWKVHREQL